MRLRSFACLLLTASLLVTACGPNAGGGGAGRKALGPAAALNAAGEPQWSVQLRSNRMRFSLGDAAPVVVVASRQDQGAKGVVWSGATASPDGKPGVALSLTTLRKPCQDATTGLSYPLTATVQLASARYAGCAAPPGQGLGPRS